LIKRIHSADRITMKISFNTIAAQEAEKQYTERQSTDKARAVKVQQSYNAYQTSLYQNNPWMQSTAGSTEKGKTLIELQQEAGFVDASVQQDYMTVMANTMSEEDYAKLQEEGFHFESMDPEEAVTIVDKIKAELARSGQHIAGYTDDLDMETLAAAVGSDALARTISQSFQQADVPMTPENIENVARAWEMASQLKAPTETAEYYMIDNGLEPEIWNLYRAQSSGNGNVTSNAPRYYAEDIQGYFTEVAVTGANEELLAQMDKIIIDAGMEVNEENRQMAEWLMNKNLPLTADNLTRLQELHEISYPVQEEIFARAAADAIAGGRLPIHGNLAESENLYEKAAALTDICLANMEALLDGSDITARRQLEEIRLRMTAEVNVKLLKSGFAIDTTSMEQLVSALKQAEAELASSYFPGDNQAVGKYDLYRQTTRVMAELPQMPAQIIGSWSIRQADGTLLEFHGEGKLSQEAYQKAQESYETLMTAPRKDMGDSIKKAFANVDHILEDLKLELSWENQRAVRILGYNRMAITPENIDRVKQVDEQVRSVIEKMTPAATLQMIRDGVNPLEQSFEELEKYFDALPEAYESSAESYSRFLYQLEQHKEIIPEEREAYIGIYRLVRQIEKSDGAVVGAMVNSRMEQQFSSLLSAVRSNRFKHMDVKATDETGFLAEISGAGNSISEQINHGIQAVKEMLAEMSSDEAVEQEYNRMALEQMRQATQVEEETIALLQRGEIPPSADNMLAAQALLQDARAPFGGWLQKKTQFAGAGAGQGATQADGAVDIVGTDIGKSLESSAIAEEISEALGGGKAETIENSPESASSVSEEQAMVNTWEHLDEKEAFQEAYQDMIAEVSRQVEEASLNLADSSMDVRGLQLIHKQLTVAGRLGSAEEYILPMYVGEELVKVHLTLEQGTTAKSSVRIGLDFGMETGENGHVEAHLQLWEGKITGFLVGNTSAEVTKLQAASDIFHELLATQTSEEWQLEKLPIVSGGTAINETGVSRGLNGVGYPTETTGLSERAERADNAQLYRMAKLFLQAVTSA